MSTGARPGVYLNRREAGRALGHALLERYGGRDALVLALPRGGVPVAAEVARALHATLDVLLVRKIGAPFNPEFAVGAVASGGEPILHEATLAAFGLDARALAPVIEREKAELERRERLYRRGRVAPALHGRLVILVDDGIATGATMEAAVIAARAGGAGTVVASAPTASVDAVALLSRCADSVDVLATPDPYVAVASGYVEFPQLSDQEVLDALGS